MYSDILIHLKCILAQGDIFGQLRGTKIRPIRVTATADEHVDLLFIDVQAFQNIINDNVSYIILIFSKVLFSLIH